jgi:hypothetical protein
MSDSGVMMTCAEAIESIRFYMEGELSKDAAVLLSAHLKECPACAKEFATRKQVLALLGKTYGNKQISQQFDKNANTKLSAMRDSGAR